MDWGREETYGVVRRGGRKYSKNLTCRSHLLVVDVEWRYKA
jgi:hypothetical protein